MSWDGEYPWTPELRARADALNARVEAARQAEEARGEPMFMGIPERWYDNLRWRCANGHTANTFLKSEQFGMDLCLRCGAPVRMTAPEDTENIL